MEINITASTKFDYVAPKNEFDKIGGFAAGVCYLPDTIAQLKQEPASRTESRITRTKGGEHQSPYDHPTMMLELINIPKIIAMFLNDEQFYTASEKSARYKRMPLPEEEQVLYDKWMEIYKKEIIEVYGGKYDKWFTESKIEKLAQENARYLTSVFTPTSMVYSISYRQFNIIYRFIQDEMETLSHKTDGFSRKLLQAFSEFCNEMKKLPYYDECLQRNSKDREFQLIKTDPDPIVKYFGDVYALAYAGSFAQLAQAQRHRTLTYTMQIPEKKEFYIPKIIRRKPALVAQWLQDCESLGENYPQGTMVNIEEMGTIKAFILKLKERNCTCAQLEIDNQTTATKNEYYKALVEQNHPKAKTLEGLLNGSRCTFPGYKCPDGNCGFAEGITGERLI